MSNKPKIVQHDSSMRRAFVLWAKHSVMFGDAGVHRCPCEGCKDIENVIQAFSEEYDAHIEIHRDMT